MGNITEKDGDGNQPDSQFTGIRTSKPFVGENAREEKTNQTQSELKQVNAGKEAGKVSHMNKTNLHTLNRTHEVLNEQDKIDLILRLIASTSETGSNPTIYFSPNEWAGFGNSFRAIRGLALYSVLFGTKLSSR